jgi:hypothetical protein
LLMQNTVQESGFTGAKKAGQDGGRNQCHGLFRSAHLRYICFK